MVINVRGGKSTKKVELGTDKQVEFITQLGMYDERTGEILFLAPLSVNNERQ